MKSYIKKVMVDYWFEFEVWSDNQLIGTYQSIVRANKILKGLL